MQGMAAAATAAAATAVAAFPPRRQQPWQRGVQRALRGAGCHDDMMISEADGTTLSVPLPGYHPLGSDFFEFVEVNFGSLF